MTWYDFVIGGILAYATFRGLRRGLVWQLAWIAALVLCFAFAEQFSLVLAPHIRVEPPLNRWIAMFILYMGFSFLSFGVARMLRNAIEKAKFVEYDRHLGGIFGFVKGVVFSLVLTFFVITLSDTMRATVMQSKSGYAAACIMDKLEPVMPAELAQVIGPYVDKLGPIKTGEAVVSGEGDEQHDPDDLEGFLFENDESPFGPVDNDGGGRSNDSEDELPGLSDFLGSLPLTIGRELRNAALDALRDADPEQRQRLMNQLQSSLPSEFQRTLDRFRDSERGNSEPEAAKPVARLDEVLSEISEIFSDNPERQQDFRDEIHQRLNDVPGPVATAALEDWLADLNAVDPDPDPETTYTTRLDTRILRQLTAARIPMSRLSQALQDRLMNPPRR